MLQRWTETTRVCELVEAWLPECVADCIWDCCGRLLLFDLSHVIAALVATRIILQYVLQQIGDPAARAAAGDAPALSAVALSVPPLVALAGFLFIVFSRADASREFVYAGVIAVTGSACILCVLANGVSGLASQAK